MQKEELVSEESEELEEHLFREACRNKALTSLVYLVKKAMQKTARYWQFCMNEMLKDGVIVDENYDLKVEGDTLILTIKAKISEMTIEDATKFLMKAKRGKFTDRLVKRVKLKGSDLNLLAEARGG